MSTYNICFRQEIRKMKILFGGIKVPYQELCIFFVSLLNITKSMTKRWNTIKKKLNTTCQIMLYLYVSH